MNDNKMTDNKPNVFDVLGPGKTFGAGFVAALLVFFSIGFFVLLFNGNSINLGNDDGDATVAEFGKTNEQAAPTAPADPTLAPDTNEALNIQPVSSDEHIRGNLNAAEVVVVEFSDFDCPFCSRFHKTMKQVLDEYGDKVAWTYRHFPLDSLHPNTRTKAEASECIADLGGNTAFWKFADIMFDDSRTVNVSQLGDVAQEVGVNKAEFQTCLDSDKFAQDVDDDMQDAVANGGRGTPYSVVLTRDGVQAPINGALPIEQVRTILDGIIK